MLARSIIGQTLQSNKMCNNVGNSYYLPTLLHGQAQVLAIILPASLFSRLTPQRCDRVDRWHPWLI
jgi:hypothetical protein